MKLSYSEICFSNFFTFFQSFKETSEAIKFVFEKKFDTSGKILTIPTSNIDNKIKIVFVKKFKRFWKNFLPFVKPLPITFSFLLQDIEFVELSF